MVLAGHCGDMRMLSVTYSRLVTDSSAKDWAVRCLGGLVRTRVVELLGRVPDDADFVGLAEHAAPVYALFVKNPNKTYIEDAIRSSFRQIAECKRIPTSILIMHFALILSTLFDKFPDDLDAIYHRQ